MSKVRAELVFDGEIRTLREDGAVAIRGVFDAAWIEMLRDGIADAMTDPGPFPKDYAPEGAGRSRRGRPNRLRSVPTDLAPHVAACAPPAVSVPACFHGRRSRQRANSGFHGANFPDYLRPEKSSVWHRADAVTILCPWTLF